MGKRLNISQPAVIQTELRPFNESFWIDANGQLEQWYYQNTGVFAPDRQITALCLTPMLSLLDLDTNTSYSSSASQQAEQPPFYVGFQSVEWKVKEWSGNAWVERTITSVSAGDNYYLNGNDLYVRKNNYDAAHAINITCRANYQDPRDVGTTCWLETTLMLSTNMDATQVYPTIDIKNPSARMFNPLKDDPIYEFEGTCNWDVLEGQGGVNITECKVDPLGTEEILPTNEEMVLNSAPTLNIHYGDIEKSNQQFMYRQTANGEVEEIVDGVSAIDNIKGNTVVWNQLQQNGNFEDGAQGWIVSGGTLSVDNKIATISATSSTVQLYRNGIPQISSHKYLYIAIVKLKANSTVYFSTGTNSPFVTTTGSWQTIRFIDSTAIGNSYPRISTTVATSGDTIQVSLFVIFDLTLMFGAGNEPSTVEEFETWLATNIGLKDYYEYCSGKLVNFGGFGVKWNQYNDYTKIDSYEAAGLKITNNNDGSFSVNGTSTGGVYSLRPISNNFGLPASHKIFVKGTPDGASTAERIGSLDTYSMMFQLTNGSGEEGLVPPSGKIFTLSFSGGIYALKISAKEGTVVNAVFKPMLFDLTLMFGAGNEPDLEWCNKYFSKDYYPYCPALDTNILNVMTTEEAGFNKWDEEWENGYYDTSNGQPVASSAHIRCENFIPCLPSTDYYFRLVITNSNATGSIIYYDKNKNFITSWNSAKGAFTTPSSCYYIKFYCPSPYGTSYNHDICINVSDPERNGEYEPYHTQYKSPEMGVKTTGFNQMNVSEAEDGYINVATGEKVIAENCIRIPLRVFPNTTYNLYWSNADIRADSSPFFYYDAKGIYLGNRSLTNYGSTGNHEFTTIANASYVYVIIRGQNTTIDSSTIKLYDICVNISDPERNGTYEPHWESKSDMSWITKIGIENFNIWDEEWEVGDIGSGGSTQKVISKNFIPVQGGQYYYFKCPVGLNLAFYDANKNLVGEDRDHMTGNIAYQIPANTSYIKFSTFGTSVTTYNHDICINLSNPHFNGRYYPHGMTAPYFPNGLCKAGSAFDEVKVVGNKIKGVVRMGSVDLGSINWIESGTQTGGHVYMSDIPLDAKYLASDYFYNIICGNFLTKKFLSSDPYQDECILFYDNDIYVDTNKYDTSATFKAAMDGVPLYYELETPYEFEIDYPTKGQFMWYGVNSSGNEVPIDQLPIYSQATQPSGYGQGTSRININALYGENIPVILRVKRYPWSTGLLPMKVTKSVAWKVPPIDVIVTSNKGGAVRAEHMVTPTNFTFSPIVNQQGEVISDDVKEANLVFKWYYVKYGVTGQAVTQLVGTGQTIDINTNTLINTTPQQEGAVKQSTNVYCEVYLLGAYHLVNGSYVRTID